MAQLIPDESGRQALLAAQDRAHDAALERGRRRAAEVAPRRSGEYAAHFQTIRTGQDGAIFNDLPQAMALERGANVGDRRGPHMGGSHTLAAAGEEFNTAFLEELRHG